MSNTRKVKINTKRIWILITLIWTSAWENRICIVSTPATRLRSKRPSEKEIFVSLLVKSVVQTSSFNDECKRCQTGSHDVTDADHYTRCHVLQIALFVWIAINRRAKLSKTGLMIFFDSIGPWNLQLWVFQPKPDSVQTDSGSRMRTLGMLHGRSFPSRTIFADLMWRGRKRGRSAL